MKTITASRCGLRVPIPMIAGIAGVALSVVAAVADAQPQPEPARKPDPTLDELLKLNAPGTGNGSRPKESTPSEPADDLTRALTAASPADDFVRATQLMEQTAHRLGQARDAGLDTQRLQEETIRLLDKMIEESTKRRRQQKSKSQQQQQQQQQSQQQQQQAQQASQQQAQRDSGSAQGNNNPGQDGPLNDPKLGGTASWGNLPAHVRDALNQGRTDRFSSLYRTLTEEYYRRLAKEPARQERAE